MSLVEISVEIIDTSDEAVKVTDGDVEAWLPKSQIEDFDDTLHQLGVCYDFEVPEWLAIKKELI